MSPQQPALTASLLGQRAGLSCKYEYCTKKRGFVYRFYRRGRYLGQVSDPKRVVAKMERYLTTE